MRSKVGAFTNGRIQGVAAYNEIAQGILQLALDKFSLFNKGLNQSAYMFCTNKTRYHLSGDDLDDLVDDTCSEVSNAVFQLIDNTCFTKPWLFWLLPNYHVVVAIHVKDT